MKKRMILFLLGLFLLPGATFGATFSEEDYTYVDQQITDDFYAAGQTVEIANDVRGDAFIGAGKIGIAAGVSQDLMLGGDEILIDGEVGDDVRAAGRLINVNSTIKDDVMLAGQTVTFTPNSFVGGDLYLVAMFVDLEGEVNGDVRGAGRTVFINGPINGNLTLASVEKLRFGPEAKVNGSLWYRSSLRADIPEGVVSGEVTYMPRPVQKVERRAPGVLAGFSVFSLLATLVFGFVLLLASRFFILNTAGHAYESTLQSIGIGFLILIVTPILFIILLATVIGIPLAFILIASWLIALYVAKVTAAFLIGFKILRVSPKSTFGRVFLSFAIGALVFALIGLVPVVGWLINFIFVLIALGALTMNYVGLASNLRKKKLL